MSKRFVTITVAILAVMMLAAAVPGGAAAWPTKPIEVIIPYAPGGGSDVTSRIFAKYFEKELGQPVVIVNIEGAQGKIGEMEVLNARPDGYKIPWQHHVLHCLYSHRRDQSHVEGLHAHRSGRQERQRRHRREGQPVELARRRDPRRQGQARAVRDGVRAWDYQPFRRASAAL